jgi:hypothetical protein
LQGEELSAFEARLNSDPALAEEVALQKMTNLVVIGAGYDALRETMKRDIQKRDAVRATWNKVAIGGSILLMVGAAYYFFKPKNEQALAPSKTIEKVSVASSQQTETATNEMAPVSQVEAKVDKKEQVAKKLEGTNRVSTSLMPSPAPVPEVKEASAHSQAVLSQEASTVLPKKEVEKVILPNSTKAVAVPDKAIQEVAHVEKKEEAPQVVEDKAKMNRFTVHASYGETWKIPVHDDQNYVLSIYNSAGQLVFKNSSLDRHITEWDGTWMNGGLVDPGVYVYIIEHANGTKENGQITMIK